MSQDPLSRQADRISKNDPLDTADVRLWTSCQTKQP
jgi:hypothetical protein